MRTRCHIGCWDDLPIEAVLVWGLAPFTTVIVFETMKVLLHGEEPLRQLGAIRARMLSAVLAPDKGLLVGRQA